MEMSGSREVPADVETTWRALNDPEVLKACIPGCDSIQYLDSSHIQANLALPFPGLKGPYSVVVNIASQQAPRYLELQLQRSGRGGSVNAVSQINLSDEANGTTLSYNANAELSGAAALANNPIGEGAAKNMLGAFFKNLDKTIS